MDIKDLFPAKYEKSIVNTNYIINAIIITIEV